MYKDGKFSIVPAKQKTKRTRAKVPLSSKLEVAKAAAEQMKSAGDKVHAIFVVLTWPAGNTLHVCRESA